MASTPITYNTKNQAFTDGLRTMTGQPNSIVMRVLMWSTARDAPRLNRIGWGFLQMNCEPILMAAFSALCDRKIYLPVAFDGQWHFAVFPQEAMCCN